MRASAGRTLWLRERSHMYSQASEPVETGKGGGLLTELVSIFAIDTGNHDICHPGSTLVRHFL